MPADERRRRFSRTCNIGDTAISIAHDAAETPNTMITVALRFVTSVRSALVTFAPALAGGGAQA